MLRPEFVTQLCLDSTCVKEKIMFKLVAKPKQMLKDILLTLTSTKN